MICLPIDYSSWSGAASTPFISSKSPRKESSSSSNNSFLTAPPTLIPTPFCLPAILNHGAQPLYPFYPHLLSSHSHSPSSRRLPSPLLHHHPIQQQSPQILFFRLSSSKRCPSRNLRPLRTFGSRSSQWNGKSTIVHGCGDTRKFCLFGGGEVEWLCGDVFACEGGV